MKTLNASLQNALEANRAEFAPNIKVQQGDTVYQHIKIRNPGPDRWPSNLRLALDAAKSTCADLTSLRVKEFNGAAILPEQWYNFYVDITVPGDCPVGSQHTLVYKLLTKDSQQIGPNIALIIDVSDINASMMLSRSMTQ